MAGAIVIIGPGIPRQKNSAWDKESSTQPAADSGPPQQGIPLACVEVLGRSLIERLVEELRRAGIDPISVLADNCFAAAQDDIAQATNSLVISWVEGVWSSATHKLRGHKQEGIDATLVLGAGEYAEIVFSDLLAFHREQHGLVTGACDEKGPLDVWVIDTARVHEGKDVVTIMDSAPAARYAVSGYVNRLDHPRDLRRLVVDSFNSRCSLKPEGREMRPGVWMSDGAQVDRGARIVAPAFVGAGTRIEQQCLITRGSNVERNSHVDYGTVVEDSSILSNSYVGIGLDISHSIVNGNTLLNLDREVTLEIIDPGVMRQNRVPRKEPPANAGFIGLGEPMFSQEGQDSLKNSFEDNKEKSIPQR